MKTLLYAGKQALERQTLAPFPLPCRLASLLCLSNPRRSVGIFEWAGGHSREGGVCGLGDWCQNSGALPLRATWFTHVVFLSKHASTQVHNQNENGGGGGGNIR